MKNKFPKLKHRVVSEPLFNIALSSITIAELEYGIAKSAYPERNRNLLCSFVSPFEIVSFEERDAENFGKIRAYLNKKGTPIGPYDLQLAAQCLTRDFCIVTNNVKEFQRVPMLQYENWVE